jgi:hypothetical protein
MSCSLCGGDLQFLGQLGRLIHSRCRACGMVFNEESEEGEEIEEEE